MAHGMLDAIVPRHKMRPTLGQILDILRPPKPRAAAKRAAAKKPTAAQSRKAP